MKHLALFLIGLLLVPPIAKAQQPVTTTQGVVVSVSRPASEAGVAALKRGGNAVDAAVATAFALAVTWPEAGNIGGGGFMLVHPGDGKPPVVIDYRETAPGAATAGMFAKFTGRDEPSPYLLVGVPGTVRGLELAHKKFGKRPWKELVEPAIVLAADGVEVNAALAESLNDALKEKDALPEFRRVFAPPQNRAQWRPGDRLVQKELAATLRQIADRGAAAFYEGTISRQLVEEVRRSGGIITLKDLAEYQAKQRAPIHGTFRGYDVYAPPPPSSGGIVLVQMLNMVEHLNLRQHERNSPRSLHLLAETMKRAYCDRARYLGDADFVDIPRKLTAKEYAAELAKTISLDAATPSEKLAPEITLANESQETTHFSIIDAAGMAVSNTYTLEQSFGGKIVVPGAGFLLNNEMGDFNPRPGETTRNGQIGTPANEVRPHKRMLSSMCPTIVCRDGKPVLVTGTPGGRTIINTVFGVLVNSLEYDLPLAEAVAAPRVHHQWFPDRIQLEGPADRLPSGLVESLEKLGHTVRVSPGRQGDAHSIWIDPKNGRRTGIADRRIDGWAATQ